MHTQSEEIVATTEYAPESIENFRSEFAILTSYIRKNFPWYDALLTQCGYDQTYDPFELPFIDDQILSQHYYNADINLPDASAYFTSGTSRGIKRKILWSPPDHQQYLEQRKRIFSDFLSRDCKSACADLGTGHAAASAMEIFRMMGLQCFDIDFTKPIEEHLELLNQAQPDVLYTMPMILENMIRHRNVRFRPKKIIVVGDIASTAWKKHITDFFSLARQDLLDIYGSIEIGSIAYECFDCGFYHFDDHIIPEMAYGWQNGVLALTSLTRSYFPAVRFVTDDIIEGFERRECHGKAVFSFQRIVGRQGHELKHGEKLSLYDIIEAIETFLPGAIFYVMKGTRELTLKILSADFTSEKADRIKREILNKNPAVEQMIRSGLVDDIFIENIPENASPALTAKRVVYKYFSQTT